MTAKTAFVLVHGAHHNHSCWALVKEDLENRGHPVVAIDLPGAGVNAAIPTSFNVRPLDPAVFSTEPSPNAGVTQEERTEAVIAAVRAAADKGDGTVVLMGHSLGGLTISPVAEAIPDEVHAVVFLTAFMLPPGMPAGAIIEAELGESELPPLFMSDPTVTGALRLDTGSEDQEYRAALRSAFYNDLSDEQFDATMSSLHPDEPAQVAGVPSNITAAKFGTVDRHYIRCGNDNTILPSAQDKMVELVDVSLGNSTTVHRIDTSHSPMVSDPEGLADILVSIAG
ncbi:MAG: alpha/beta fold hydrolase [Acidimicrobiia bacterium]